jgi:hypothetical protein
MKKFINLLAIVFFSAITLLGVSAIAIEAGFDVKPTIATVLVASALFAIAKKKFQFGVGATGLDVSQLAVVLGDYIQAETANIWKKIYQGLEFEAYMRKLGGKRGKFSTFKSSQSDVLQAFQPGFTKKGETTFTPYINEVYRTKVDFLLDDIDEIYSGYLGFMADETINRADWPITKYIINEHLIPKIIEELNIASARGSYLAPTPGTAGNSINICNGILTIVANEITATNITPITTGAITAVNALDKMETFLDDIAAIDPFVLEKGAIVHCSKSQERFYKKAYRDAFGSTNDQAAKNQTMFDHYNVKLVGLNAFGNSERLLLTEKDNIIVGYDKIYTPNSFKVEEHRREVAIMTDFHRGYGFGTLDTVFVNDRS